MLLSAIKKILSIVMAAVLIVPITVTAYAESESPEASVLWPYEIPFKIILPKKSMLKQGIVYSDEFEVVNMGDNDVEVELSAAKIQIENDSGYYISDTRELPETGSNIFIELLFSDDEESSSIVITDTPSEVVHTYHLKAGEVGKFKFDGTVNEMDGISWSDAVVQVQICIKIIGAELLTTDEEQPDEPEKDEEIDNAYSDNDETLTPTQEATHDADVATDTTEADNTNDADNKDVQEPQSDTETEIEESARAVDDDDVDDINNQADNPSDTKSGQGESSETV